MEFKVSKEELDILVDFLQEAEDHLDGIEEKILQLESSQDASLADSIFRPIHTIKGTSSFLKLDWLTELSHELETLLDGIRKGNIGVDTELVDILLEGTDQISGIIQDISEAVARKREKSGEVVLELSEYNYEDLMCRIREFMSPGAAAEDSPLPDTRDSDDNKTDEEELSVKSDDSDIDYASITFPEGMKEGFEQESLEHLENVEDILLKLEKDPENQEFLDDLFRSLHSLKGNAGVILSTIEDEKTRSKHLLSSFRDLAHKAETLIQKTRDKSVPLSSDQIELLLSVIDGLKILLQDFQKQQPKSFDPTGLMGQLESVAESGVSRSIEDIMSSGDSDARFLAFTNSLNQCLEAIAGGLEDIKDDAKREKAIKKMVRSFKTLEKLGKKVNHELLRKEASEALNILDFLKLGKDENEELFLEDLKKKLNVLKEKGDRRAAQRKEQAKAQAKKPAMKTPGKPLDQSLTSQIIRVPQERLDKIMNLVGELIVSKNNFAHLAREISIDYELPELGKKVKVAGDIISRIADELQATIMKTRMLPISNVFSRFPRMVRELSKSLNKKIRLEISGEETELDKTVIEAIGDPLVHLIRNSADHGIEPPEERLAKGKPEEGVIRLQAYNRGQNVFIDIIDDGRGLDPEKIKKSALKKGIISEKEINEMDEHNICNLIFFPGFSTAQKVSEVSGRGVGMDVVKTNIEKIGGNVVLHSSPGEGTTISIRLPLTLATSKGLEVETCEQHFYIPLDYVVETVKIEPDHVHSHRDQEMAVIRGKLLPIFDMAQKLELIGSNGNGKRHLFHDQNELSLVILNVNNRQLAVKVDRFYNESEFVIKSLGNGIAAVEGFSGATVTGEGKVILVLDPPKLF
ncbi:MAG TPA: hypothetical protein ENG51_03810 [Deltaproteobacteria bacterium]|nr:hypothetical protein [Deltaproteobacteria bacterium]